MNDKAIQDYYEGAGRHCYGCGTGNDQGLGVRSYWDGEQAVCRFAPAPCHTGIPGYVYGGLIASVIDCHATATAAAAACQGEGSDLGAAPLPRFVTGSLHVDYLRPTPIEHPMELRARVVEAKGRKAVVAVSLMSDGTERARGRVVAIRMPADWLRGTPS